MSDKCRACDGNRRIFVQPPDGDKEDAQCPSCSRSPCGPISPPPDDLPTYVRITQGYDSSEFTTARVRVARKEGGVTARRGWWLWWRGEGGQEDGPTLCDTRDALNNALDAALGTPDTDTEEPMSDDTTTLNCSDCLHFVQNEPNPALCARTGMTVGYERFTEASQRCSPAGKFFTHFCAPDAPTTHSIPEPVGWEINCPAGHVPWYEDPKLGEALLDALRSLTVLLEKERTR